MLGDSKVPSWDDVLLNVHVYRTFAVALASTGWLCNLHRLLTASCLVRNCQDLTLMLALMSIPMHSSARQTGCIVQRSPIARNSRLRPSENC